MGGRREPLALEARPIGATAAMERAAAFLRAHSSSLTMTVEPQTPIRTDTPTREIIVNRYPKDADRTEDYTVVVDQHYQGIPVFEAEARVCLTASGEIWQVSSQLATLFGVPDSPTLDAAAALTRVRTLLGDPRAEPEEPARLYVYPPSSLAWRYNVLEPHFQEVLVDAATGTILLARGNVRDGCTVTLTVKDTNDLALPGATGEYYVNSILGWSLLLDANAQASSSTSAAGNAFCRAKLLGSRLNVKDYDSGGTTVAQDTATFATVDGGVYSQTLTLNNSTGVNSSEGSVAFREAMRAWHHVNDRWGYDRPLVNVNVDAASGPSCSGNAMSFPRNRARLDNGPPNASASIDDTILHEYGHTVQYAAYGNTWGRPSGCTCVNHGGTSNDCSFDAFIEGWAEYFPVLVYHQISSSDTAYDWSNSSSSKDIETNADTSTEERDEWTFAGALFDVYDSVDDAGDALSLGDDEIWIVMRNDVPRTVEQFFQKFITRYPAYAAPLEQIWLAHNMHPNWLTLNTTTLDYGDVLTRQTFTVQRLNWYGNGTVVQPTWAVTADVPWVSSISPSSDSTTTETDTVTVTIHRALLSPGTNIGTLTVAPQYYGRARQIALTAYAASPPATPTALLPLDGATGVSLTPVLTASAFSDADAGDTHAASRWQIDDDASFSTPVYDSQETAAHLTELAVPAGVLTAGQTYFWHVKYKDSRGTWSDWSATASFRCTCSPIAADFDEDCDIDADDCAAFVACALGPAIPQPDAGCQAADFDEDGDVDAADFAKLQRCISGAARAADPACLEP
jgi:hypothetical protein